MYSNEKKYGLNPKRLETETVLPLRKQKALACKNANDHFDRKLPNWIL